MLEFNIGYAQQHAFLPLRNMGEFLNIPPHALLLYDSMGKYNWTSQGGNFSNPLALLEQTHRGVTQRLSVNHRTQIKLSSSLRLGVTAGMNTVLFDETTATPIISQRPGASVTGSANFGSNAIRNWSVEPQLEYKPLLRGEWKLDFLAGASLQASNSKSSTISGTGYNNDALLKSLAGAGNITASNDKSEYRYQAAFFRGNLRWKDHWLMNITARRDGSSRFGPNKRFANFGAAGLGWIFSKEPWLLENKTLSFGKIRASYGVTGSDQIRNYQYLDSWIGLNNPYQGTAGLRPNKLYNPDYSWEQIRKFETGIELGFLRI
ncbi:MAG: SusC/RagA family TonB-linked outer membrane protein, partial [Sphingobacteriales bacterium]